MTALTEQMIEAGAKALWHQARSAEYDDVFNNASGPMTWQAESEEAKEIARDMARACLVAALSI